MFRALASVFAFMAVFVVVGTAVSAVMMRRASVSLDRFYQVPDGADQESILQVLRGRAGVLAGEMGVSRWSFETQDDRILLQVHGSGDLELFSTLLGQRGLISLREGAPVSGPSGPVDCPEGFIEAGFSDWIYRTKENFGEKMERRTRIFLCERAEMEVSHLADCTYHTEGIFREPVITLRFVAEDVARFSEVTAGLAGRLMAICIDGDVRAAGKVSGPIDDGRVEIRGLRDNVTAKRLAALLRLGALPAELKIIREDTSGEGASTHGD